MSIIKKVVSVVFFTGLAAVFGYLLRIYLARTLLPEELGLYYAVCSFVGLFVIFQDLGLGYSLAKHVPEYLAKGEEEKARKAIILVCTVQLLIGILVTSFLVFFAKQISTNFIHEGSATILIILASLAILLAPLETFFIYSFQSYQKTTLLSLTILARSFFLFSITVIATYFSTNKVVAAVASTALVFVVFPLFFIKSFQNNFPGFFNVKLDNNQELLKTIGLFGLSATITIFSGTIMQQTDTLVLTYFRSLKEVAVYNIASPLAKALLLIPSAIQLVFLPMISQQWNTDPKKVYELTMWFSGITFALVIIPATIFFIFPHLVIGFLFQYTYIEAVGPLRILTASSVIAAVATMMSTTLLISNQIKNNTLILVFGALINLVLAVILVPNYGVQGVAYATLIGQSVILVLTFLLVQKLKNKK